LCCDCSAYTPVLHSFPTRRSSDLTVPVQFGDRFLVGEQMVEVQETPESTVPEPIDDGTYFFGSPRRPAYYRVVQILRGGMSGFRSEEHTSELQSRENLVCRLLLEK